MHRGVREFIRWVQAHRDATGIRVRPPASAKDLSALEHQLGTPLPADLRHVLGVLDGAVLPNGTLLAAAPGPAGTIEAALTALAEVRGTTALDPELPLPFHWTEEETYLAFDRSAAPVQDTWPVVDYEPQSGELRLLHRTFDGWCRLCVAEWTSPDYADEFSVEKYLAQGKRHAKVEPDVSIAHVTVAHALRRAGEPEYSLEAYLRAGRCVPPVAWADWEALKLAVLLRYPADALEAGARLGMRSPRRAWGERGTTPSQVCLVLARGAPAPGDGQHPWLRVMDQVREQALDDEDRTAARAIRAAVAKGEPLPGAAPPVECELTFDEDLDVGWTQLCQGYKSGAVREEHLVLDAALQRFAERFDLADVLRIRRDF